MEYPPRDGRQAVGDGIIPVLLGRPGPYVGRGIYRRHDDVARKEGVDVFRRALPHRIDEQARKEKRRPLGMLIGNLADAVRQGLERGGAQKRIVFPDRTSSGWGKRESVRLDRGGPRN